MKKIPDWQRTLIKQYESVAKTDEYKVDISRLKVLVNDRAISESTSVRFLVYFYQLSPGLFDYIYLETFTIEGASSDNLIPPITIEAESWGNLSRDSGEYDIMYGGISIRVNYPAPATYVAEAIADLWPIFVRAEIDPRTNKVPKRSPHSKSEEGWKMLQLRLQGLSVDELARKLDSDSSIAKKSLERARARERDKLKWIDDAARSNDF